VSIDDMDFLVEESFWLRGALEQNPVPYTEKDVIKVWESLLGD
jgi:hypothetical protein